MSMEDGFLTPPEGKPRRGVGNVDIILDAEGLGLVEGVKLNGRVLMLANDPTEIAKQLGEEGEDVDFPLDEDLVTGVSTDAIIKAKPDCYYYDETLGRLPLRSLQVGGTEPISKDSIASGDFAAIVAGSDWGCGSSREHAALALLHAGIGVVYAPSIAPIHFRNLLNSGMIPVTKRELMERLIAGDEVGIEELSADLPPLQQSIMRRGGLFRFLEAVKNGDEELPVIDTPARPMTIAEKILAQHMQTENGAVKPGDSGFVEVDASLCHDYTTAQAFEMVRAGLGREPVAVDPERHHSFPDHLTLARAQTEEAATALVNLRRGQRTAAERLGINFHARPGAENGGSDGICHYIFREQVVRPGNVVFGTDSHTCSGGSLNAYAVGVGSTEIATSWEQNMGLEVVPRTVKVNFTGSLPEGCTGKDIMIALAGVNRREGTFSGKVMEFQGEGLESLTADDQWVLGNMATECSARTGIVAPNNAMKKYLVDKRGMTPEEVEASFVQADEGAEYDEVIDFDLSTLVPHVSQPGHTGNAVPLKDMAGTKVDLAYSGSCTAGSLETLAAFADVVRGRSVSVETHVQAGSIDVLREAQREGVLDVLRDAGVTIIEEPGCGACIGAGPGGPEAGQVSISATNRNFPGRMGPGNTILANPRVVAMAAVLGRVPTEEEYRDWQ